MTITFLDSSNQWIDHLVELCTPVPAQTTQGLLITPPLVDLKASVSDDLAEDVPIFPDTPATPIGETYRQIPIEAFVFTPPTRVVRGLMVAVDSGVITLGNLVGGGVAFAIRGSAVCFADKNLLILRYKTGPLLITQKNILSVFRYIGTRLGNPDLYVKEENNQLIPQPSVIESTNQITDRCRNFIERMIQEEALGILAGNGGGTLLVDGALTVSYDTPKIYLEMMLRTASRRSIGVCAISKRSRISIGGVPVDSLFDAYPTFVGYAPLLQAIDLERQAYSDLKLRSANDITEAEEVYAVRFGFGPPGLTFRVDVTGSPAASKVDVLNDVYFNAQMVGGYPKPLIDAHQYSSFLPGEAMSLLADLVARTGIRTKEEPSMGILFQPFGAFGK
ncbi:DNA double-strand break repair nuclease NurA [Candidatus Oscillochloris fontis]|uniref:DNA double-strand break repair nuclease NurA n=1 Tax=Candidatus Oscillochloris fontis TaxID=2496868 RepID=UPI00101BE73C|nr:DNA double-strand break repair nuclease NurA [Candidatus Oscillochloris fontis]